ncbi:MAG: GGDEF domain-containing protein [Spirochaetes bacterium]|nr:GGDEF domain-containing protein [Spirochaetota bacterium]
MDNAHTRKPRIAYLTTGVDSGGYAAQLLAGFNAVCESADASVFVFGVPLGPSVGFFTANYDLIEHADIDGIAITTSVITHVLSLDTVAHDIVRRYRPRPIVSIGAELPGIPSIVIDNESGVTASVEHLVRVHGRRRIGFMRGYERSINSRVRFNAYRTALARCGLAFDESLILEGDFARTNAREVFRAALDRGMNCDAFIAANDPMALGIMDAMRERGLTPGQDIAVTGFDNREDAIFNDIPVTTVSQPTAGIGAAAARTLLSLMRGETTAPPVVTLAAPFLVRSSCGCSEYNFTAEGSTEIDRRKPEAIIIEQAMHRVAVEKQARILRLVSGALISSFDTNRIRDVLIAQMPNLGISFCLMALYDDTQAETSLPEMTTTGLTLPAAATLVLAYDASMPEDTRRPDRLIRTEDFISGEIMPLSSRRSVILLPLYFGDRRLGILALDIASFSDFAFDMLRDQVSAALYGALLNRRRSAAELKLTEAMEKLAEYNKELTHLAQRDELTGLYNRRGFLDLAEHALRSMKKGHVLFIIDLDGLKSINDNHGHLEGDNAIVSAARILSESFRQSDIVARIGGDEFVVLSQKMSPADIALIRSRIETSVDSRNRTGGYPYRLSMSIGTAVWDESTGSLDDLLSRADELLYHEKQEKKKR